VAEGLAVRHFGVSGGVVDGDLVDDLQKRVGVQP
jgi:hypothetical protein